MVKKKAALSPIDKKVAILVALYLFDSPDDGPNAYTLTNKIPGKVEITDQLEELLEQGYIKKIKLPEHIRKNAFIYNITPVGKSFVDFVRKIDEDPNGKTMLEWSLKLRGLRDGQFKMADDLNKETK